MTVDSHESFRQLGPNENESRRECVKSDCKREKTLIDSHEKFEPFKVDESARVDESA